MIPIWVLLVGILYVGGFSATFAFGLFGVAVERGLGPSFGMPQKKHPIWDTFLVSLVWFIVVPYTLSRK